MKLCDLSFFYKERKLKLPLPSFMLYTVKSAWGNIYPSRAKFRKKTKAGSLLLCLTGTSAK
ncbi:hypothetical protein B9K06_10170 [Bacillus sp. OG2]|nr:hypothetical protein B9K06_10170 [Bacillus sp. OG2]